MAAEFFVMTEKDVAEVCRDWIVPLVEPVVTKGIDPFTGAEKEYRDWLPRDVDLASPNLATLSAATRELRRRSVEHFELKISFMEELDPVFASRPVGYAVEHGEPCPLFKVPFPLAQGLLAMASDAAMPEHCALFVLPEAV